MAPTILAVDDDPFILKSLERYLCPEGFQVVFASSGESALDRIEKGGVDLVILDLHLPKMDGFEVCRRIKTTEGMSDVPVIMLTAAYVDSVHEERGYEAGADAYMAKPLMRRPLLENIRLVLSGWS